MVKVKVKLVTITNDDSIIATELKCKINFNSIE
jgi:hypothetical protein